MSIFKDVTISWKGKEYIIKSDRVMGLVDVIEDSITIEELQGKNIKRAKLSKAYADVICYAGGRATVEDVYNTFFSKDSVLDVINIVAGLLGLMIPPEHLQGGGDVEEKKDVPA